MEHGLDDEEITADNNNNGTAKLEETGRKDVALVVHSKGVRVEGTPLENVIEKEYRARFDFTAIIIITHVPNIPSRA
jgi:hypothetical protein